jgi:hypothetical protein
MTLHGKEFPNNKGSPSAFLQNSDDESPNENITGQTTENVYENARETSNNITTTVITTPKRTRGQQTIRVYDEDEESVDSIEDGNDNHHDNDKNDDDSMPGLQDREVEDSSDEEDAEDDEEKDEERKIVILKTKYKHHKKYKNLNIPELICRKDNDDSSDDDSTNEPPQAERLRGGVGRRSDEEDLFFMPNDDDENNEEDKEREEEEEEEEEDEDDEVNERAAEYSTEETIRGFIMTALDDEESEPIGGRMDEPKLPGMIRISGCNPNGIKSNQLKSHLQHAMDQQVDVQCYSEVNTDFLQTQQRQQFYENTKAMDRQARSVWGTSHVVVDNKSAFKPGGTAIVAMGKTAGRVKKSGMDSMGRWTYQLLDGKGGKDILIVSIYQCCKQPTNPNGITAYHQQEIMLSETNRVDRDPRRNFYRDIKAFLNNQLTPENNKITPIVIGDWNEECKGTATSQKLCDEFGLVNIFDKVHPNQEQFKTYMRGTRTIDFALAPPELANKVTNFTYEPFMYRLKGDHRAYYFDIGEEVLFGNKQEPVYDPAGRTFSSKDPKAVTTYLGATYKHLQANAVMSRIKKLLEKDTPDHDEAEKLDELMTQACTHAANQCKKRRVDYWNIEIHETKRDLSVWCQYKNRRIRKLSSTALIHRTANLGIQMQEGMPMEEIVEQIEKLRSKVKELHKNSAEKRDESLLERANMAEDEDDKKKAKAIRQMKKTEKDTRAFQKLKFKRGLNHDGGGISRLQVPVSWPTAATYDDEADYDLEDPKVTNQKDPSKWKEINCPKEIEFLLRLRNQRHFGQAESDGTPFTKEAMKHKFNWSASTNEAELVLKGEYNDEELSDITRLFLDNMTRITEAEEAPKFLTRKEFTGKFKVWRESTSTSPSGRHLGHYKALVAIIDRSLDEEDRLQYKSYQEEIAECYIGLINYAIKHRYSLRRWKTIVNMMIYKEHGNVKIHRLRVIHLYEADLSLLWGVKWREGMHKALKTKALHQGQYGGLPGRDCTSLTYLEELRFDYSKLTRYPVANFDNDATACYDRILCAVASLAGRKYGIHKDVIFIHAQTLEEAEFKLKSATKVSETSYRHCIKFPIHGTGQGSSNSPTIWCFISSVLFQCHNEKASGMLFTSPERDMVVRFNMVGFVDDSTCITGGNPNDTLQELLQKMKDDAQLWHDLLWCSGGKLELSKCGYHVIHFDFEDSGIPTMRHSPGVSITLQNEHGDDIPIKSKNIYQTRVNLGHAKSPADSCKTEFERTLKKSTDLGNAIAQCGGTRAENKLLYRSVWKPAVEYTLPQSFLSEKQLKTIEKASMPKIYARCGYNRNTARAVLAGPIELGGGGFTPLYVTAGTGYVTHFLKNWRTPTEDIGKQVRIVYAWTAYQAGVTYPILEHPERQLDYISGRVIPGIRKYLEEIDGKIFLHNKYIRTKLREEDKSIMERVTELEFTQNQRERINCVRMYLGVMYLSEICNTTGDSLQKGIGDNTHDKMVYKVTTQKPKQKQPNSYSWKFWMKAIKSFTKNGRKLNTKLGPWTADHSRSGIWASYQWKDRVYELQSTKENGVEDEHQYWNVYKQQGYQLSLIDEIDLEDFNIKEGTPIQINSLANGMLYGDMTAVVIQEKTTEKIYGPDVSWDWFIHTQPKWVIALLDDVHFFSDDGYSNLWEIVAAIEEHGYLLAVSDGSVKSHDMSFGWILSTPTGDRLAAAAGPCNGRGNSLRAEGAGMLSVTMFIALITKYLEIEQMRIVFISDNSELIRRLQAHKHYKEPYPNETLKSEFDVTEQIYRTTEIYGINATYKWVRGHQDKHTEYDDLPLEAQLNVDADKFAGDFQIAKGKFRPMVFLLPSCDAMLSIRGISITSNYRRQLIRAYVEPEYIQYLQYRFSWSKEIIEVIAWKCLSLAIRRIDRDVLITKVCNDLLPTAETLYKMRYQHYDTCILCHNQETRDHIIRCKSPSRIKWRQKYIIDLRKRMDKMETEFAINETLSTAIAEWLETGEVDVSKYPIKYANAILSQERIGWRHFFAGKISQEWTNLYDNSTHITERKKRDGYVWGAALVEVTLRHFIQLWELRNEEVHGKTVHQQEKTRKTKLSIDARKLNELKDKARPVDMGLFHSDIEVFLDQSTAQTIATFISSHRKAIANSVKKHTEAARVGATSVMQWIRGWKDNDKVIERMHARQRKDLLETDGRKKERRRRQRTTSGRQKSIVGFMSLTAVAN